MPVCIVLYMCCVSSPGCRGTACQTADLKRSPGLMYLNKLYLTSPVSCTTQLKFKVTFFYIFVVSRSAPSFLSLFLCVCVCVLSGAAPLPRVDTVAGRLQECDALSQVSASVSVLPTSITKQLRSLYSHQLPSSSLLLYLKKKNTSSLSG